MHGSNETVRRSPYLIRTASAGDADAISRLIVPLVEKYIVWPFEPEDGSRLLDKMTAEAVTGYIAEGYRYHVAEQGGEIVGVAATRDNAHLYHLFVADSAQRQGLATALWETARDACLATGNPGEFTVNASRYAEGFYRQLGFERVRERRDDGVAYIEMRLECPGT